MKSKQRKKYSKFFQNLETRKSILTFLQFNKSMCYFQTLLVIVMKLGEILAETGSSDAQAFLSSRNKCLHFYRLAQGVEGWCLI